jgi:uncharacterized protein
MVVSDDINVMLLTAKDLKNSLQKRSVMPPRAPKFSFACLAKSRANVDDTVHKAVAAAGSAYKDPQDYGFMYGEGFQDSDGHIWELIYMESKPPSQD